MRDKGSMTVYISLTLAVLISLITASLYSVQLAGARVQMVSAVDQGLYSLFARYDRELLERYHLFFIDGSRGSGSMQAGSLYRTLEKEVVDSLSIANYGNDGSNIGNLNLSGGISAYTLASDGGAHAIRTQAAEYMRETLGLQGVRLLRERSQSSSSLSQRLEQNGNRVESQSALEDYASLKAEAEALAAEQARMEEEQQGQPEAGTEQQETVVPEDFINPVEIVKELKSKGILSLVLPEKCELSAKTQELSLLASGRSLETGLGTMIPDQGSDLTTELLFGEYILQHCGSFTNPRECQGLEYQVEYILQGNHSDEANLKAVVHKLLLLREISNLVYLYQDPESRAQAQAVAGVIASLLLLPQATPVLEGIVLACWAYGESVLDVRELLAGGKVPIMKDQGSWQLTSLNLLPRLLESGTKSEKRSDRGLNYSDYLRVLLGLRSSQKKLEGCMDMMEMGMRAVPGKEKFRIDCCVYGLEAVFSIRAMRDNTFEITRSYGYDM